MSISWNNPSTPTESDPIVNFDDDVLIRVDNVSKRFCRDLKKSLLYGLQDVAFDLLGRDRSEAGLRGGEFLANQKISFELRRGECLGLIGHNGAGKTTLLKMLNGLITPDVGRIEMRGRVSALIALGAGFNPILTGRENVYIAGSVLGLSKQEIDAKYNEIVEFAQLEEFMESPVQNYSSGMQVRLGFAVASSMEPDILLIDEVLAVGDANFRSKCYSRIDELKERCAIILVTHHMQHIGKITDRVCVLNRGNIIYDGAVDVGIQKYNELNQTGVERVDFSNGIILDQFTLTKLDNPSHRTVDLSIELMFKEVESVDSESFHVHVTIQDQSENIIAQISSYDASPESICFNKNEIHKIVINASGLCLKHGKYCVSVQLLDARTKSCYCWSKGIGMFNVEFQTRNSARYLPVANWEVV
jgi:lipopolysaccharide transport system ATP-binding protein